MFVVKYFQQRSAQKMQTTWKKKRKKYSNLEFIQIHTESSKRHGNRLRSTVFGQPRDGFTQSFRGGGTMTYGIAPAFRRNRCHPVCVPFFFLSRRSPDSVFPIVVYTEQIAGRQGALTASRRATRPPTASRVSRRRVYLCLAPVCITCGHCVWRARASLLCSINILFSRFRFCRRLLVENDIIITLVLTPRARAGR